MLPPRAISCQRARAWIKRNYLYPMRCVRLWEVGWGHLFRASLEGWVTLKGKNPVNDTFCSRPPNKRLELTEGASIKSGWRLSEVKTVVSYRVNSSAEYLCGESHFVPPQLSRGR